MTSTTPIREDGEQEQLDVNDPNQRSLLDRSKTRQHSAALSAFSTPGIVVNNDDILHELPDGSSLLLQRARCMFVGRSNCEFAPPLRLLYIRACRAFPRLRSPTRPPAADAGLIVPTGQAFVSSGRLISRQGACGETIIGCTSTPNQPAVLLLRRSFGLWPVADCHAPFLFGLLRFSPAAQASPGPAIRQCRRRQSTKPPQPG